MSLCKACIHGVRHEGTPEGKFETIGGVNCYVGTPSTAYPRDTVILFLTDVFGINLPNALLLVDDFARNGFKTIAPDYLNGEGIPENTLRQDFDLPKWLVNHGPEQTRPPLDSVITSLKEQGVTRFGATGYCFGGRYVFDLAYEHVTHVSVANHPSLLQSPEDFEKYFATSHVPLLINSCPIDEQFPTSYQAAADEVFGDDKFKPGYQRELFQGCTHGFAVRGDLSDPAVKKGKEGAFKAAVEFFVKHL